MKIPQRTKVSIVEETSIHLQPWWLECGIALSLFNIYMHNYKKKKKNVTLFQIMKAVSDLKPYCVTVYMHQSVCEGEYSMTEKWQQERERDTAARFSFWFIRMTHRSRDCISPTQINGKLVALGERTIWKYCITARQGDEK